jgi:hypothetical protein
MDSHTKNSLQLEHQRQNEKKAAETIAHLRARLSIAEKSVREYQSEQGRRRALEKVIVEAVTAAEPYPHLPIIRRGTESPYPMCAVADLSDLHIGEVVRPDETEGWGEFNWAIAQERLFKYAEKIVGWATMHRHSFTIDDLYVLGKGDYITGNIHEELMMTNEFPPPVQAVNAGSAIGEFLLRLAPHFQHIHFIGVGADNHGRLSRKPQAKLKASHNYSFVVHEMAKAYANRADNIDFIFAPGMKWVQEIANHRFLIEHSDTVKAVMGIPYYGMERMVGREARRRMLEIKKSFHYWSIGHWHVAGVVSEIILVNGALTGTTEYDHSFGRHARPAQVSYLVHPKYGIFDWTAWKFPLIGEGVSEESEGKDTGNGRSGAIKESPKPRKVAAAAAAGFIHGR